MNLLSPQIHKAFALMQIQQFDDAKSLLNAGLKQAIDVRDINLQGIYYSAFGILHKLQKEYREAWKFYDKAEKCLPDNPTIKIISARLLVEYFAQYEIVLKKLDKVASLVGNDFILMHQVFTVRGIAYLKMGKKKEAIECLRQSIGDNFNGLKSADNLDFHLLEEMLKKKWAYDICKSFLEKALAFTKSTREEKHGQVISRLLQSFPA